MSAPLSPRLRDVVLVHGFLTAVMMWTAGYVCRLPLVAAPAPVLAVLLALAVPAGGFLAARAAGRFVAAPLAGLLASVVNLLVLGSLVVRPEGHNELLPSAAVWVPGSLVAGALLAALGGAFGVRRPARGPEWSSPAAFSAVTAAATLLLVIAGGLVTGAEAGMAVPDWPSSFGSNMFLYPVSRMTGGIYYEHTHRLFGTLVGLCALVLVPLTIVRDHRRGVKVFTAIVFAAVVLQGVLGGLRVTRDDRWLASLHATLGQAVFGAFLALAAVGSPRWRSERPPRPAPGARVDRGFAVAFLAMTIVQVFLGALIRQLNLSMHPHITGAVVVFALGLIAGIRLWGLYPDDPVLRRTGTALMALVVLQVALGIAALVAAGATIGEKDRPAVDVLVTTAHQAVGALILGAAVLAACFTRRLLTSAPRATP